MGTTRHRRVPRRRRRRRRARRRLARLPAPRRRPDPADARPLARRRARRPRQADRGAGRDASAALASSPARSAPEPERRGRRRRLPGPRRRPVPALLRRPDRHGPRAGRSSRCCEDRSGSLEQTGRALIAAANEAGGRDNITVILFRLEEVDDGAAAPPRPAPRRSGRADRGVRHVRGRGAVAARGRQHARRRTPRPRTTRRRRSTAATAPWPCRRSSRRAVQRLRPASHRSAPRRCRTRRRGRRPRKRRTGTVLLLVAIVIPVLVGGVAGHARGLLRRHGARSGAQRRRSTAGCPTSCRSGSTSTRRYYESGVPLDAVPQARRATLHRPPAALARRRRGPRDPAGAGPGRVTARNRELLALVPASLLLTPASRRSSSSSRRRSPTCR